MRLFVAGVMLLALGQLALASPASVTEKQQALLKRWALSRCLAKVYPGSPARDDANATASSYLEAGSVPADAYLAVDKLATEYANRRYSGAVHSSFGTKKCIDLFDSRALDDLTARIVTAPSAAANRR
ncbi:T6SS amidase immunity protein Tai4 family protein [Caballeronia sp. SL2Y3]|uniref:T6SS amidase immunity protein Tai4 family protein n=1 Tax=Caballeronia sp. SL2Y3 TaxID=2878151 RepID=UPI001FD36E84|nr:T6SS amidase immunity protein Tai4 family protein [Caballeronia sp. SL2Y3]